MKNISHKFCKFFFYFVCLSLICLGDLNAQISRTFLSKNLDNAYKQPKVNEHGYLDRFIIINPLAKSFSVSYQTQDPVTFVAIKGGLIKGFIRSESGTVSISFAANSKKNDQKIELTLFTVASLGLALNEETFGKVMVGSWFSSYKALLTDRPIFFDEPIVVGAGNSISWSYLYQDRSRKKYSEILRAYIPNTALTLLNNGATLFAADLIVRSDLNGIYSEHSGASVIALAEGILVSVPATFSTKVKSLRINIAKR